MEVIEVVEKEVEVIEVLERGLMGMTGPIGPTGPAGETGENGISAYEVAVANGFVGTEEQWLASLVGPQGAQGPIGSTGATGPANSLSIGTVASGETASATITGTAPSQTLSLVLPKGDKGDKGDTGASGASTWDDISGKPESFPPEVHAASHLAEGSDPLFDQNLSTTDDVEFNALTTNGQVVMKAYGGSDTPNEDLNAVLVLDSGTGATNAWINVGSNGVNASFGFTQGGTYNHGILYRVESDSLVITSDGGAYAGLAEDGIFLTANDDVGIGVMDPEAKLDISGNVIIRDAENETAATFDAQSNLSDDRVYTLPDASGTLALAGDAPAAHAASHLAEGSDPLYDQDLSTTDTPTFNGINSTYQLAIEAAGAQGEAGILLDNTQYGKWLLYTGAGVQDAISIYSYGDGENAGAGDVFCCTNNNGEGRMGIFTPFPATTLDVNGTAQVTELKIKDIGSNDVGTFVANGNLTDNRTYDLPDASGTIALSDQSLYSDSQVSFQDITTSNFYLIDEASNHTASFSAGDQLTAARQYLTPNASGILALTSDITKSAVGLSNVTNNAQTQAAIVPNTAPSAGQILAGNSGGTAYAPVTMSGDATLASTGALTLANSGVSASTYKSVTVDAKGRVTAGTNPTTLSGYGITDAATSSQGTKADSALQPTLADAKGDLLVATANDTIGRLAVSGNNGYVLTEDSSQASGVKWAALPAGGTKTVMRWDALMNQPPSSNYATLDTRNSIAVLDFDASTDESAIFVGLIPEGASLGSGLTVYIHWMATTATSGNVRWGAQIERSNTDLDSDSFDTATEANGAANGTSGIVTVTSITLTNIDSVTAGDLFRLKIYRNADDATNDTMSGDAELVAVEVRSAA